MPLPYRSVKDLYDALHDSGIVTQDLPSWAQGMNALTESDTYSAGLNDNWIKRASVNVDRALDWTGAPKAFGAFGESIGSIFGVPEAGRAAGEMIPRGFVNFAPMFIPGGGAWTAARLGGTAALSAGDVYTQTGSPAAGVTAGAFNALLPGVVNSAERFLLSKMGVKATEGAFGNLIDQSIRANATPLQRGAAYLGGQVAAFPLMGGQEVLQQGLDPNQEITNPFTKEFMVANLIGELPFSAIHGASKLFSPSGTAHKASVDAAIATIRDEQARIKAIEDAKVAAQTRIAPLDPTKLDAKTNAILERTLTPDQRKYNVDLVHEALDLARADSPVGPEERVARTAVINEMLKDVTVENAMPSKDAPPPIVSVEGKVLGRFKNDKWATIEVADTEANRANGFTPGSKVGFWTMDSPEKFAPDTVGTFEIPKHYHTKNLQDRPEYRMRQEAQRLDAEARAAEERKQQGLVLEPTTEAEVLRAQANEAAFLARKATIARVVPEIDAMRKAIAATGQDDVATRATLATQLQLIHDEVGLPRVTKKELALWGLEYGTDGIVAKLNETQRRLEASLTPADLPRTAFEGTTLTPVTEAPSGDITVARTVRDTAVHQIIHDPKFKSEFWDSSAAAKRGVEWEDERRRMTLYFDLVNDGSISGKEHLSNKDLEMLHAIFEEGEVAPFEMQETANFPMQAHVVAAKNAIDNMHQWARDLIAGRRVGQQTLTAPALPGRTQRIPAGGTFVWSFVNYDPTANKLGKHTLPKNGIVREAQFKNMAGGEVGALPDVELQLGRLLVPEAFDNAGNVNVPMLMKGLKEKGPTVVTTESYGMEGKVSEAKAELDRMTHDWLDTLPAATRDAIRDLEGGLELSNIGKFDLDKADKTKLAKYLELSKKVAVEPPDTSPRATSYYKSISPFDTEKYPVVRIDVVLPRTDLTYEQWLKDRKPTQELYAEYLKKVPEGHLWNPDNIHENLPNTLGWAMVQFVPDPRTGETVMFVGEQQSRWGQQVRKNEERAGEAARLGYGPAKTPSHPLLPLQHVLVLKAAIAEAQKRGVTKMVVSDAETAMMTELHDKAAEIVWKAGKHFIPKLKGVIELLKETDLETRLTGNVEVFDKPNSAYGKQTLMLETTSVIPARKWIESTELHISNNRANELTKLVPHDKVVSQSAGMRLLYDTTLQSAMRRLTGDKGEKVEMGVHKNAVEVDYPEGQSLQGTEVTGNVREGFDWNGQHFATRLEAEQAALGARPKVVGSPVFRNPDGTPKSSVTGIAYDLTKAHATLEAQGGFTLSRPSYVKPIAEVVATLKPEQRVLIDAYKLQSDGLAIVRNLADTAMEPGIRATMKFIAERSPAMLQRIRGLFTKNGYTHHLARLDEHTGDLVITGSSLKTRATLEYHIAHEAMHAVTEVGIYDPKMADVVAGLEALRQKMIARLNPILREVLLRAERTGSVQEDIRKGGKGDFKLKNDKGKWVTLEQHLGPERGRIASEYLYSLLTISEFVSEGMLPTQLRAQMLGVKTKTTIFTKFMAGVKKLLGLPPEPSIHDEFLFHTNQIMEHSNTLAKSFDYLETYFQDRSPKPWSVANAFARDAVDLMNFHGTEKADAGELLAHLGTMATTTMSIEFQKAQQGVQAIVEVKGDSFKRLSDVLGEPASTQALDAWLDARLNGASGHDELQFMPTAAHDYITEKARNMRDVAKAVAAISHPDNAGVVDLMNPSVLRASSKEMVERLNTVIAEERERARATETAQAFMSMLPDVALEKLAAPVLPGKRATPLQEQLDDPKGLLTSWFDTANQIARKALLFREWLTGLLAHETQGRHAAVESNKIFGHIIAPDGTVSETFDVKVGNDRMRWLSKGGGKGIAGPNARVVDAWIDLNNREGGAKATILPAEHVEVKKLLAKLSPEDRVKAAEFVTLISHGNKTSQQSTLEFMRKEAASYGAQAIMLGSKDTPVDAATAIRLADTVVRALEDAKRDPSKATASQGLLGGVQQQLSPEAFKNLVQLADAKAGAILGVAKHFDANPGWVSAKRYRKNLFNWKENGVVKTDSADDMAEAQRIAGDNKVYNFRPNAPGEFVEFGPRNSALLEEMQRSDDLVYDMMKKLGASTEQLEFLAQHNTGVQWARAQQMNYDVGATTPRTARTLGRTSSQFPWTENYFHWTDANAGYWSRRLTRTLAETLMAAPEYKADPVLVETIRKHVTGYLSPDPELARKITKATAIWNLGFQLASPIVNLGQPFFRGIPEIMRIPGISWWQATKLVSGAIRDFAKHKFTMKNDWTQVLSQEEQEFMSQLRHDGVIDKSTFDEHYAQQLSYGQNMINAYQGKLLVRGVGQTLATPTGALANVAMSLFKQTEVSNNSVVSLAAYRAIRQLQPEKGVAYAAATARDINAAVNDTGGRVNRMIGPFSEPGKVPRSLAMIMSSMQSYNIGSLNQLIRHFQDAWRNTSLTPAEKFAARKAFFAQMGMQFAAAGLLGMPFAASMLAIVNTAVPDLEVNKKARELINSFFAADNEAGNAWTDMAMTGVPSMFGWDIQSRLSSGNILPGVSEWNGFQPEALLGVPVMNVLGVAKGVKGVLSGDAHGALAFVPPAFRKMAELIQGDGKVLDYKNRPVIDDLTPGEKVGIVMGFNPKRLSDVNAAQRMAKQSEEVNAKRKAQFREQMAEEALNGNFGTVRAKLTDMAKADPNFNPVTEVRSIAQYAENQAFPRDLRRESKGDARSRLLSLWNLSSSQPTEQARLAFRQKVEQSLGVQPTQGRAVVLAQLMDSLRLQHPSLTTSELRRLADAQISQRTRQTLQEPLE